MQTATKGERMLTYTSCNLQRNNEKTKSENVSGTGKKIHMQKQNICQEMLHKVVNLQLLKNSKKNCNKRVC